MQKLTHADLYPLEQYAKLRNEFRAKVMEHKKHRRVAVGPHATLFFEDRLTMHYQVQEMLRAERIFEEAGIQEELEAYNPLIPDGGNWKATLMIQYDAEHERRVALAKMIGIEDRVWVRVDGHEHVFAIADEDLERENADKTSSVHFLRFELTPPMIAAVKKGVNIGIGIAHPAYDHDASPIADDVRAALARDLD